MLMRCMALMVLTAILCACGPSRDGELLWQFEIKKSHMQWGAVDAGRLYLCADDVYCLDIASGRLLWEVKTFGTHASAPVVDDGRLYFQCGGLYALDAATGSVLWEFWTSEWATAAPAAEAGKVYAQAGSVLYCLDAASGKRLWSVTTGLIKRPPVVTGGRIFFCIDETIVCLDAESGRGLWRFVADSGRIRLAVPGGALLSVSLDGIVRSHRVETGEVLWELAMDKLFPKLSVLDAVHVLISAGALYCVNLESGMTVWTFHPDKGSVRTAYASGPYFFLVTSPEDIVCVAAHDRSLLGTLHLPEGGLLLKDGVGAIFVPGGKSRTVNSISVRSLLKDFSV